MENSIGPGALKISLFQTVPGEELAVKELLEEACRQTGIRDYVFFKALGTFDIVMIYVTKDYDVSITKFGPIPNILKSNHLLCYSYKNNKAKSLVTSLKTKNLIGLSLLKIDPLTQQTFPGIERVLRQFISEKGKEWRLMGSIGWNEITMIVSLNSINGIVKELLDMSSIGYSKKNIPVLAKTLSFVCLNYQCMPSFDVLEKELDHIKEALYKHPFLRDEKVMRYAPLVEVTAKPIYVESIKSFFNSAGFRGHDLLGKCDLSFACMPSKSWADCLASILYFRHHFGNKAFSTSTRLRLRRSPSSYPYSENPWRVKCVKFSYKSLEQKYGQRVAASLANHLYSFNSLIQNPLYGSAFLDMMEYPEHILTTGDDLGDRERLHLAHGAREVIRYGSELRLCGTFQSIEEETGKFSEIQGGGQRALLALEHLPYRVFNRLNLPWSGFVITSHYDKLMHINEVIQVPTYTLWRPQDWWTLYHEIGHIWIDVSPEVVSHSVPAIQEFLVNKGNPRHWLGKLTELAAEIIGFELGFFGDYDLFLKLYWNHITNIDPTQRTMFDFGDYAMRSFFVWLFYLTFHGGLNGRKLHEREFRNVDLLYREFLKHMDLIEMLVKRKIFRDKLFIAAEKAQQCAELYQFASNLATYVNSYRLQVPKGWLTNKNTEKVIECLSDGRIWWNRVSSPEAIVYRILKLNHLTFEQSIATVITFWNQQVSVLKKRAQ